MHSLIQYAILSLFILAAFSVDENKFRKCTQAGFCSRHRSKPIKNQYYVNPTSVALSENLLTLELVTKRPQQTTLTMNVNFLNYDTVRVRIIETNPLDDKQRYEPDSILKSAAIEPKLFTVKEKTENSITLSSVNGNSLLKIKFNEFKLEFYVQNELKISINDQNLFYFEVTRRKEEVQATEPAPTESTTESQPEEEKEIVDYNEAGQPIYADGSLGASPSETTTEESTENQPAAPVETANEEEKEDETGYWSESFGGHTDTKPYGPQSVGCDFTFHNVEFLYGIPEHATNIQLQSTVGENAHYKEPYRLYNLDVFEYESDKPMALYGSIPLLVGLSKKTTTGFFWLNPSDTYIDISNKDSTQQTISSQWMSESGIIDLFLFSGPTPTAILTAFSSLVGFTNLPPYFSLGYHQSRWNYRDEEDVLTVHKKFEELNFPYDVLWLDIEHTDGKKYFTWDKNAFPHPTEMIDQLAKTGHRLVTIVDPHVKKENGYQVYEDLKAKDMLIKTASNSVYEGWCWPGASSYPDFTSSSVRDYWASCFNPSFYPGSSDALYTWNDMNEPSVFNGPEVTMPRDNKNLNGYEQRNWHNVYGIYYHMANYNGQLQRSPKQRPFILTRSFFAGSQQYGAFWIGDTFSNWIHLRNMIPMLLNNGLAGYSFGGADIPGFFKDPESEELVVRWYQDAVLTPFFRAHAHIDTKRREPWTFSEATYQRLRNAIILRYTYLPYLYTVMQESTRLGTPVIRPLFYHYIDDSAVYSDQQNYLVGRDLLILPVTQPELRFMNVYLPDDDWYNIMDHSVVHGKTTVGFKIDLDSIPVLQRFGSILARQMRLRRSALQTINDPFTLNVLPSLRTNTSEGQLYLDSRDGFEYRNGDYAMMKFSYENQSIRSKRIEGKETFQLTNTIERITVYYTHEPSSIVLHYNGEDTKLTFVYDSMLSMLTIRKPNVPITSEWTIDIM